MRLRTALACTVFLAGPAFAAGSQNETPPKPTETTKTCLDGEVFDEKSKTCVKAEKQSLNDDDRYRAVRELAYAGRLESAMQVLAAADNPRDARFLNYRAFILRQSGDMEGAMGFYNAALKVDPDYILARSYMGIGLLQMGDRTAAEEQLAEITKRGGEGTWAYRALSDALSGKSEALY